MTYSLNLPGNYVPPPLPGRDEWVAALSSGRYVQGRGHLRLWTGHGICRDCVLGVLCDVQNRPAASKGDSGLFDGLACCLGEANPVFPCLKEMGYFPPGVTVVILDGIRESKKDTVSKCNDYGLTFDQLADIITRVWSHAPKNWP